MKKSLFAFCLGLACLSFPGCRSENPTSDRIILKEATKTELRSFKEGDQRAFFHADLKFVNNPEGTPAKIGLHEKNEVLKEKITLREGKKVFHPFYVFPPETSSEGQSKRDVMILFDVSGSMNFTDIAPNRFEVAKNAAREVVRTFRPGDQVAVASFDSRQVKNRIDAAQFQSPSASQIDELPRPVDGNTALYSATDFALDRLNRQKQRDSSRQPILIILTDGRNDVGHRSDDPGLMTENDLSKLTGKIDQLNIQVFTIGFGQSGKDFDEDKLRQLTYPRDKNQYFPASDAESLRKALGEVREQSSNQLRFAFFPGYLDYQQLKSLSFEVEYETPSGRIIKGVMPWDCGASSGCVAKARLSGEESVAALGISIPEQENRWKKVLLLLGQLAIFSGGIAALWFLLPRLLWPSPSLPQLPRNIKKPILSKRPSPANQRGLDEELPSPREGKGRQRFEETRIYED